MTEQEIFNKVWNHFIVNKGPFSIRPKTAVHGVPGAYIHKCSYRGDGGAKCAVGILIDDEHYSAMLEGKGVRDAFVREALKRSGVSGEHLQLLNGLQEAHDFSYRGRSEDQARRELLELKLRYLAQANQLEVPS